MGERCEITELERTGCAHCRGLPAPGEEPMVSAGEPPAGAQVRAMWAGKCTGCGERFPEGAVITAADGGGWLADCCIDREDLIDHE